MAKIWVQNIWHTVHVSYSLNSFILDKIGSITIYTPLTDEKNWDSKEKQFAQDNKQIRGRTRFEPRFPQFQRLCPLSLWEDKSLYIFVWESPLHFASDSTDWLEKQDRLMRQYRVCCFGLFKIQSTHFQKEY